MMVNKNYSDDHAEKAQRSLEYIECLEEERRKIQVFRRELPLCLDLVSQGMVTFAYCHIGRLSFKYELI